MSASLCVQLSGSHTHINRLQSPVNSVSIQLWWRFLSLGRMSILLSFPHKQDKLHFFGSRQGPGVTEFFPPAALFLFLYLICFFPSCFFSETPVLCFNDICRFQKQTIPCLLIKLSSGNDFTQSPCHSTVKKISSFSSFFKFDFKNDRHW